MSTTQESTPISNSDMLHPVIVFGAGLIAGSLIGFTGIVILGIGGVGYYYRDNIIVMAQEASKQIAARAPNLPTAEAKTSWMNWGKNLVGLGSSSSNAVIRKKSE